MTIAQRLCAALALAMAALVPLAAQPTPEQRYFEWTDLPFPPAEYAARRAALTRALDASGGGVFLAPAAAGASEGFTFRQLDTFWYLTGLELPDAVVAIDSDRGRTTVYAPPRDARFENPSRRNDFPGRPLQADAQLGARSGLSDIRPLTELEADLAGWVADGRLLRVDPGTPGPLPMLTVERIQPAAPLAHFATWVRRGHPAARLTSAYREVALTRMVKSAAEIARLRRSARLGVDGIAHAARAVHEGIDERGLEAELEAFYKRGGAARLPFASIIKSGPNSLWPWRILATHNDRRNRTMRNGELVIFDVGCELDGYVSDVGRTFPVSGRFTDAQRAVLDMQRGVSDAIIAAMRPGVMLADVQRAADAAIPEDARPYMQTGSFFGHHLGLSSGDPSVDDVPLAPGMVITVEPWYYNHDRGMSVFIEDDILITTGGRENLTGHVARTADGLEALMRGGRR
ncbi:MAG TPA: Xaa-Pro peptidase family protein [Vicinamibacterales bacterium]|nr:Xaa-Pro peptidase family protein [Vicinamibacterales bacterium]